MFFILSSCMVISCTSRNALFNKKLDSEIKVTRKSCSGTYDGPEFINGSDVAHQFSNKMSKAVGDQLKLLFDQNNFVKVDLEKIQMTTQGMDNRGSVSYHLHIPFINVEMACDATTSFDHRGGWDHKIERNSVLKTFGKMKGLEIIELSTKEGLQEFWIQWRNSSKQSYCN